MKTGATFVKDVDPGSVIKQVNYLQTSLSVLSQNSVIPVDSKPGNSAVPLRV